MYTKNMCFMFFVFFKANTKFLFGDKKKNSCPRSSFSGLFKRDPKRQHMYGKKGKTQMFSHSIRDKKQHQIDELITYFRQRLKYM